jgi:hypothetical protein
MSKPAKPAGGFRNSVAGELFELAQSPMDRSLAGRRIRASGKLAERVSRMAEPEVGSLAERRRKPFEPALGAKALDSLELEFGGAARSHEIRVIRVRQPVRLSTCRSDNRTLLERKDGFGSADDGEQRLDRVPALRVGRGMRLALDDAKLRSCFARHLAQEHRRGHR